jgi:Domain of unknown function (DUF4389)
MTPYPVDIEVVAPAEFSRLQLVLRIAFGIAIGYVGISLGWLFGLLYLVLPLFAAIVVSDRGGAAFVERSRPLQRVLRWVVAFYGYLFFVTDRFPTDTELVELRVEIQPVGTPTVGSALGRLLTSIPATLVLAILFFASCLIAFVAAIAVLLARRYPPSLHAFQCAVLRWQARLLVYHASLVDVYPPFAFDTHVSGALLSTRP